MQHVIWVLCRIWSFQDSSSVDVLLQEYFNKMVYAFHISRAIEQILGRYFTEERTMSLTFPVR